MVLVFGLGGLAFFALSAGFIRLCDALRESGS